MTRPRLFSSALLAILLAVAGLSAGPTGPSPAAASASAAAAACEVPGGLGEPFLSGPNNAIRFQGFVECDFTADVISIEARLVRFGGGTVRRSRFVPNSDNAFISVSRGCRSGLYAGTLAADAYRGGNVVASVREVTNWISITC
jgi:hypothetical protein